VASSAFTQYLLIPGTSSIAHLRENLNAGELKLPSQVIADLTEWRRLWAGKTAKMLHARPDQ